MQNLDHNPTAEYLSPQEPVSSAAPTGVTSVMNTPATASNPVAPQSAQSEGNFKTMLQKYKVVVAFVGIILFALLALITIWYIRQARQPLAPTAPVSIPKAGEVCTVEYTIEETCTDLEKVATTAENKVQFRCLAPAGTDQYIFEVRYAASGEFQEVARSSDPLSPLITQNANDYVEIRCTPCAGEYCASAAKVAEACSYQHLPPSPSPSPSPSPTPEPAQCNESCSQDDDCAGGFECVGSMCRAPECTDQTDCSCDSEEIGFYVEKYHDLDGDGTRDSDDAGLDWEFEWDLNNDNNWRAYTAYQSRDGRGGNISNLKVGDVVRIREKSKSGWVATTGTEKTITIREQLTGVRFGNWQPPASPTVRSSPRPASSPVPAAPAKPAEEKPAPTPKPTLPQAGSTAQTVVLSGFGAIMLLIGVRRMVTGRWL